MTANEHDTLLVCLFFARRFQECHKILYQKVGAIKFGQKRTWMILKELRLQI